jgi:TPR repeat protein
MKKKFVYAGATAIFVIAVAVLSLFTLGGSQPASENQIKQWQVEASAGATTNGFVALTHAAEAGQARAQRALGEVYLHRGDHGPAEHWLKAAASGGDAASGGLLGRAYFQGSDGFAQSYGYAFKWLQPSAARHDPSAAYYLGLMYKSGYGVSRDAATAAHWFSIAADQQLPQGMFMLGNAYRYGDGVAIDTQKAVSLYQAAAEMDLPEAIQTLLLAAHHGELGLHYDQEQDKHALFEMGHAMKERPALP